MAIPRSPVAQHHPLSLGQQQVMSASSSILANQNPSLCRNNRSIQVITAPLNNVMEHQHPQQCHQQQIDYQYHHYNSNNPRESQLQNSTGQHCEQIVANIENNSINYELDDDISYSQISFKHHLRQEENNSSRGSMHNVMYDNASISTTNTSTTNKNLTLSANYNEIENSNHAKMSVGSTGGAIGEYEGEDTEMDRRRLSNASSNTSSSYFLKEGKRASGSSRTDAGMSARQQQQQQQSVFIENRDILNDQNYPKLYYRHSTVYMPTTATARTSRSIDEPDERDRRRQQEMRRYSDTKLLNNNFHFENEILLNRKSKDLENILGSPTIERKRSDDSEEEDEEIPVGANKANFNELLFENCDANYDPLELNIQKMLELDLQQQIQQQQNVQHVPPVYQGIRIKRSLDNVLTTMYGDATNYPHSHTHINPEQINCRRYDNNHGGEYLVTNNRTLFKSLPNLSKENVERK